VAASATVSMPFALSCASRSVPGKASRPFLFWTTTSPGCGCMDGWKSAFQLPSVKSLSLAHPARMPSPAHRLV